MDFSLDSVLCDDWRNSSEPKNMLRAKNRHFQKLNRIEIRSIYFVLGSLVYLAVHFNYAFTDFCVLQAKKTDLFGPKIDCGFCEDIGEIVRRPDITPSEFRDRFAYGGRPLIVTAAAENWPASRTFSLEFFIDLFAQLADNDTNARFECQFFPYQTRFRSVFEVFALRQQLHERDWYVGWANCDSRLRSIFAEMIRRPDFLPDHSEQMKLSWIFMGRAGPGAHLHLDNVFYSSWQAQIRGAKEWKLEPPLECHFKCSPLTAIVREGDINTNLWYHQTRILSDNISITIGAEFD